MNPIRFNFMEDKMKIKLFLSIIIYEIIFCSTIVFAEINYEIELANTFKEYYIILQDNDTKDELKKNGNVHLAVDLLSNVIRNYPATLTTFQMISLLDTVQFWENDKILKERYLNMKDKYLNTLNDPNTDTADKLLFMILTKNVNYVYTLNNHEEEENFNKRIEGLIKMKDECKNIDYRALALYCLLYISRSYNDEILLKYTDHPIRFIGEQNAISYKYVNDKYENIGNLNENINELKTLYSKYKDTIMPGGEKMEIHAYDVIAFTYAADLKDYENAKIYLNLIENKAPNYYRLSALKKVVENLRKKN